MFTKVRYDDESGPHRLVKRDDDYKREEERERERERSVERILLILYFLWQRNISIIIHNVCAFLKGTYDLMYIIHTSVVGQTSLPFLQ